MSKLNGTQLALLAAAAKRADGAVLPVPKRLKLEKQALDRALKTLLKQKLISESPAAIDAAAWHGGEHGARIALSINEIGLRAIGLESNATATAARSSSVDKRKRSVKSDKPETKHRSGKREKKEAASKNRSNTKQATVIEMLQRAKGATVDELMEATGWQPHSVRGVISGALKKKLKLKIITEKQDSRGRVYRIADRG